MRIISRSFGEYCTNCYIVAGNFGEIIIDPGVGACDWISDNCKNPLAILNTHGHFDHIFDNKKIKDKFNINIFMPKDDAFLCQNDPFGMLDEPFLPDVLVKPDETIFIAEFMCKFHHFAGHTPGSSMIEISIINKNQTNYNDMGVIFSGDFIFKGTIGRYDFAFSDKNLMKNSLAKVLEIDEDVVLYPGHGQKTTLMAEKQNIQYFLNFF